MIKTGVMFLVICMLLRASDVLFRTSILEHTSVIVIVGMEHVLASLVLFIISLIRQKRLDFSRSVGTWILLVFLGCCVSVGGIWCFTKAFLYINPAVVIILQKLQPLVVCLVSVVFLKERVKAIFYLYSFLGVVCAYFMSVGFKGVEFETSILGLTYACGAVIFWALGTVVGKALINRMNEYELTSFRYYIGALFCCVLLVVSFVFDLGFEPIKQDILSVVQDGQSLRSLVYMALVSGGLISLFCYYHGLVRVPASLAGLVELVYPIGSLLLSWLVLNYEFHWYELCFGSGVLVFMWLASSVSRS